jgi:hypothetical protein
LEYFGMLRLKKQVRAMGKYLSGSFSDDECGAVNLKGMENSLAEVGNLDRPEQKLTN